MFVVTQRKKSNKNASSSASCDSYECSSSNRQSIKECSLGHEKYNSDSPYAEELTKAVGYFIAKDLMPTSVRSSR